MTGARRRSSPWPESPLRTVRPRPAISATPPVESNAQILESRKELDVTGPHTAVYRVKYSKRILTYSGKIRESEVKIPYNPACEEARLVSAVVTSPTGERQEISKDEINVMDEGWNASAKRYTGGKILVASLPGVEVGSTIEVEFEIVCTNKPFLAGFESFQLPDELEQKSFTLTAPANVKVQRLVSGIRGIIREQDKRAGGRQEFRVAVRESCGFAGRSRTFRRNGFTVPVWDILSVMWRTT